MIKSQEFTTHETYRDCLHGVCPGYTKGHDAYLHFDSRCSSR